MSKSDHSQHAASNTTQTHAAHDHSHGQAKIGRNDPCPCGSGKKYKKCCIHLAHTPHHHHCSAC